MKIAAVSANYGGYDTPKPFPCEGIEAVLVSDAPIEVEGWTNVVEPRSEPPRLAAKAAKVRPDHYVEADLIVWLDASYEITDPTFLRQVAEEMGDAEFGAFRHYFNHSLTQEAACAAGITSKYDPRSLRKQVRHYLRQGHPDDWGMWMSGLMARRMTPRMQALGDEWWAEMVRWGVEDQIPLPVLLRRHGVQPVDLRFEGFWEGTRFMRHHHTDGT